MKRIVSTTESAVKTTITEELRKTISDLKDSLELVVTKEINKSTEKQEKNLYERFSDQKEYLIEEQLNQLSN